MTDAVPWAPEKANLVSDQIRRSLELAEESISVDPFTGTRGWSWTESSSAQ